MCEEKSDRKQVRKREDVCVGLWYDVLKENMREFFLFFFSGVVKKKITYFGL